MPIEDYHKLSNEERENLYSQFLREPDAFYEKAEMDLLRNSIKLSYKERFLAMTRLMKIGIMLKNAKITHQPISSSQNH